jgi:hypothetical protein
MQSVSRQQLGKHVPAETNTRPTMEERCFLWEPSPLLLLCNVEVNTPRQQ